MKVTVPYSLSRSGKSFEAFKVEVSQANLVSYPSFSTASLLRFYLMIESIRSISGYLFCAFYSKICTETIDKVLAGKTNGRPTDVPETSLRKPLQVPLPPLKPHLLPFWLPLGTFLINILTSSNLNLRTKKCG